MVHREELSRHSTSLAVSIALHFSIALLLLRRGVIPLVLAPSPLVLTFVDAGLHTEGPGARSDRLQVAAGAPAAPAPAPIPPAPAAVKRAEPPAAATHEPLRVAPPAPVAPVAKAPPKHVAVPKEPPKEVAPSREAALEGERNAAKTLGAASGGSAPGSVEGGASGGRAPGTGAGGDDAVSSAPSWAPAAKLRYEELLFAWMERHKDYPLLAQRRGLEGSGALRVRIDRSGHVVSRELTRSTGTPLLDQAALEMVRRSSPFPAVPTEYSGATFEFVAPVEYRLR